MNNKSADKKMLCVCLTPLQVLIASRVSEENGFEFDLGLYISSQRDAKHELYFKKMGAFCKQIEFVLTPRETYPKGIKKYLTIFERRQRFLKIFATFGKYSYALTGSSINPYLWSIVQTAAPETLETFDDGLVNIASTAANYHQKTRLLESIFFQLSGLRINKEKMIQKSSKHYSIYDDLNWYKRTCYIPLYENKSPIIHNSGHHPCMEIFIGPTPETPESVWQIIENHLRAHPETTYLKHPREETTRFVFIQTLNTNLIIEDYVIQQMQQRGVRLTITGTESTALFNLSRIKNVNTQTILPNIPEFKESRSLMEKHGVSLLYKD